MKNFPFVGFCVKLIPALVAGILLYSCTEETPLTNKVDFDRKSMLTNWADNILLPAFENFNQQAHALDNALNTYYQKSDQQGLETLRNQFIATYKSFQQVKPFEAGPSEDVSLRASLNTFPADTAKIVSNITNDVTDLSAASNLAARGFPALDYLLFSSTIDLHDPQTQAYLSVLLNDLTALADEVNTGWKKQRSAFINASGTDLGSSLGQMVNAINKDYEIIKNANIGFPAGKRTLGKTYPHTCEAYFSGISIDLAITNIQAIESFFQGISFDGNTKDLSLEDYIIALGTTTDQGNLDEVINDKFDLAISALKNINSELSVAVDTETDAVDAAYLAIQQNVRYLKVDMPSAMGVLITYQDNDGD